MDKVPNTHSLKEERDKGSQFPGVQFNVIRLHDRNVRVEEPDKTATQPMAAEGRDRKTEPGTRIHPGVGGGAPVTLSSWSPPPNSTFHY